MTVVNPTDRPKSVRYRCVIEVSGVRLLFRIFCGCRGFSHRIESDVFFFSFSYVEVEIITFVIQVGVGRQRIG